MGAILVRTTQRIRVARNSFFGEFADDRCEGTAEAVRRMQLLEATCVVYNTREIVICEG